MSSCLQRGRSQGESTNPSTAFINSFMPSSPVQSLELESAIIFKSLTCVSASRPSTEGRAFPICKSPFNSDNFPRPASDVTFVLFSIITSFPAVVRPPKPSRERSTMLLRMARSPSTRLIFSRPSREVKTSFSEISKRPPTEIKESRPSREARAALLEILKSPVMFLKFSSPASEETLTSLIQRFPTKSVRSPASSRSFSRQCWLPSIASWATYFPPSSSHAPSSPSW
mmetsp:Transcript_2692/g.4444  ORF Transcript_2692/g.4444 Transcript_2692/m.4444 type:complete len:228 (-) Transcript_2692:634-1317(-)